LDNPAEANTGRPTNDKGQEFDMGGNSVKREVNVRKSNNLMPPAPNDTGCKPTS